jgi:hypothetical protein
MSASTPSIGVSLSALIPRLDLAWWPTRSSELELPPRAPCTRLLLSLCLWWVPSLPVGEPVSFRTRPADLDLDRANFTVVSGSTALLLASLATYLTPSSA